MFAASRSSTRTTRTLARQRAIDVDRDALARKVVHDIERAKAAAIGERIDHEIHRPALARTVWQCERHTLGTREMFPRTTADLETRGAIHTMHPFVIGDHTLARDQRVKPAVPEPGTAAYACRRARSSRLSIRPCRCTATSPLRTSKVMRQLTPSARTIKASLKRSDAVSMSSAVSGPSRTT